MKIKLFTVISVVGILFILFSQGLIVYQHYKQAREFLIKESDAILETAFRKELSLRTKKYSELIGEERFITPPPPTKENTVRVDISKMNDIGDNSLGRVDLAMNYVISTKVPVDVNRLDSLAGTVMADRNIHSAYFIKMIDAGNGKLLQQSDKKSSHTLLSIDSRLMLIDFQRQQSLQIVLTNPFIIIFKQMGILVASSLLISVFCFYGLWLLFRTQLRQKKLIEVKNEFFGNTAHELKRPVAQLRLALEALSKSSVLNNEDKRERYLAISREATRDMGEKINMIMTLSMAEEGVFRLNYSQFNLVDEVLKLKEQFTAVAGKEIQINIDTREENLQVKADRDHICQCVANLIDNAIKYSGISVAITITLQRIKDSLRVSVSDNGMGIAPDKINHIFDKYFRANAGEGMPNGFGIGLSYVKAVVEKHNGRIEVSSEQQKGSEFRMYLPMS